MASDDYIKGYNDALGDVMMKFQEWKSSELRKVGDPVVTLYDVMNVQKACKELRKVVE